MLLPTSDIRSPISLGLGNALRVGLKQCNYEYDARMDSDDIAVLNRMELQLKLFNASVGLC